MLSVHVPFAIDPEGPFGAKEAGEGPLLAAIPAVANAIYDAVGVRMMESPFTPEKVLEAIERKKGNPPFGGNIKKDYGIYDSIPFKPIKVDVPKQAQDSLL